jgi:ABC-type transport system involved in cytochrome bd biosynthesis fused ATPase/permease subunit
MNIGRENIGVVDGQNGNDLVDIRHEVNKQDNYISPLQTIFSMTKGPVIVITGTPGTGKSTHAALLANQCQVPLKHINVGEYVKEQGLYHQYDQEWQSYTVDEDRVRMIWLHIP